MFTPSQNDVRRFFCETFLKQQANEILTPMEAIARDWLIQHPEYAADPSAEIKQSLALLKDKPLWKERYEEFIESMVYDSTNILPYDQAINVLEGISANVIKSL